MEGATPPFSALVRHRGGVSGPPFGPPLTPPLGGVAPSTVIPADCFVAYHNPFIRNELRVLDDALPPIRSTVMKQIFQDPIGR